MKLIFLLVSAVNKAHTISHSMLQIWGLWRNGVCKGLGSENPTLLVGEQVGRNLSPWGFEDFHACLFYADK